MFNLNWSMKQRLVVASQLDKRINLYSIIVIYGNICTCCFLFSLSSVHLFDAMYTLTDLNNLKYVSDFIKCKKKKKKAKENVTV